MFCRELGTIMLVCLVEKKNMAVIEKVYQRLKDDKEIQGRIRQAKAHPWVRVVEKNG